ncbi:hypothetical protein [Oceanithermus sp.]
MIILLYFAAPMIAEGVPYCSHRYTHVVGQADWYTCGAAATATLLTYYYGDPATEGEILEIAVKETEKSGQGSLRGPHRPLAEARP